MNKIALIIQREFLTRVKKKSFIVMTILGPLLFASMFIVPIYLSTIEDTEVRTVAVIDSSKIFIEKLPETKYIKFKYLDESSISKVRDDFKNNDYYALLFISHIVPHTQTGVRMYSDDNIAFGVKSHIENAMEKRMEKLKLREHGIDDNILQSIRSNVIIKTFQWREDGEEQESSTELAIAVGYAGGFLIYMFIFLFGAQVMRGVIEEKTNRIVEVIVSSVKPFQLMMGKILGIAFVGLTQFLLWVILTSGIVFTGVSVISAKYKPKIEQQVQVNDIMTSNPVVAANTPDVGDKINENLIKDVLRKIGSINYPVVIGIFIFFFLGGYFLYGSLFAAIGAAVDNETETQQFMAPITIPLILGIVVLMSAVKDPDGPIAFWFSIIPFTSPVVMMARIPAGVPYWEVALSMSLLVLTFIGSTWLAGKIYRTGILMYGKKTNYKELWKWLRYKN